MADLAGRLANRIQLSSDGFLQYPDAVEEAFRGQVDFGVLNKSYSAPGPTNEARRRYSPAEIVSASKAVVNGNPDLKHIST